MVVGGVAWSGRRGDCSDGMQQQVCEWRVDVDASNDNPDMNVDVYADMRGRLDACLGSLLALAGPWREVLPLHRGGGVFEGWR